MRVLPRPSGLLHSPPPRPRAACQGGAGRGASIYRLTARVLAMDRARRPARTGISAGAQTNRAAAPSENAVSVCRSAVGRLTIASWTREDRPDRKWLAQRHAPRHTILEDHYAWSAAAFRVQRLVRLFRLVYALLDVVDDLVRDACALLLLLLVLALLVVWSAGRRIVGTGDRCQDQESSGARRNCRRQTHRVFQHAITVWAATARTPCDAATTAGSSCESNQSYGANIVVSDEITAYKPI